MPNPGRSRRLWTAVVYVGSDKTLRAGRTYRVHALGVRDGCSGRGPVWRSAVRKYSLVISAEWFYAVAKLDGKLLWKTHVDTYFAAMVTATPVLYKGVLYVGVSSFEEVMAGSPKYPCCGFRGIVEALEPTTGHQIWKTYTIDTPAAPIPGTTFRGPSGAGVWSSPTIDEKLHRLCM